jgi:hypothetical protein
VPDDEQAKAAVDDIPRFDTLLCPVLLGSGRPLLSGVTTPLKLDLLEVKKYPSGDVLLRYARP